MSLHIRRLSHALGAEIGGIDIQKPLHEEELYGVRSAFLEHGVLLFRNQPLTQEQHIAFSRQFGELEETAAFRQVRDHGHPEIALIVNKPNPDAAPAVPGQKLTHYGAEWHSDKSYKLAPTKATILKCVERPDVGGDTLLANCALAYETLSDGMKKLIDGLHAAHVQDKARSLDHSSPEKLQATMQSNRTAQPIARVHPETGRKSLFLGYRIKHIVGMTPEESAPLLQFLLNHSTRPQLVYRHVWQKHDLLMWDNRCTMHLAVGDYDSRHQLRHMEKTSVKGTPSGYAYSL